jgi:hypothetical protein
MPVRSTASVKNSCRKVVVHRRHAPRDRECLQDVRTLLSIGESDQARLPGLGHQRVVTGMSSIGSRTRKPLQLGGSFAGGAGGTRSQCRCQPNACRTRFANALSALSAKTTPGMSEVAPIPSSAVRPSAHPALK